MALIVALPQKFRCGLYACIDGRTRDSHVLSFCGGEQTTAALNGWDG